MNSIIAALKSSILNPNVFKIIRNGHAFVAKYLDLAVSAWHAGRDIGLVLHYARFSIAVLLIGGALLFMPQGRELAMRIDSNWLHFVWFYLGLFFWALQNWFGSRRLLHERFGRPDDNDPSVFAISLRHVPRIMGLAAYLFATIALLFAWYKKGFLIFSAHALITMIIAASGVLFYYLIIRRRDWMLRGRAEDFDDIGFIHCYLKPTTMCYSLFFIAAGIFFPASVGFWMGSLAILSFGLSSMVPVGNWAIRYTEQLTDANFGTDRPNDKAERTAGFPVITSLVILALLLSFINDNHDVRILPDSTKRPTLDEALVAWERAQGQDGAKPLIVVATAGGGIRASFWTATALGGLTDAAPQFRNALFAISGVSGGSVGSAFYRAALQEGAGDCAMQDNTTPKRGTTCLEAFLQKSLDHDFLAPNLSNLLYSDLIQRFLPPLGFPDRQQALEKGWELAFEKKLPHLKTGGLSAPLSQQIQGQWLPMLLLNSTHMETGKRVVASSMALNDAFTDTVDLQNLIGNDIRLSTAAGNSARFTYVSPAGTLPCKPSGNLFKDLWQNWFCHNGHVVDGGYFENFGAITALQNLQALAGNSAIKQKVKPILIVISSDPLLACSPERKKEDDECDSADETAMPDRLQHESGANESLGPVKALLSTRSARGILATKEAKHWVETCASRQDWCGFGAKPEFFHLRMEVPQGEPDPALGWMLSEESEQIIANMLTCSSEANQKTVSEIMRLLGDSDKVSEDCV